jgi:hypothetical protein
VAAAGGDDPPARRRRGGRGGRGLVGDAAARGRFARGPAGGARLRAAAPRSPRARFDQTSWCPAAEAPFATPPPSNQSILVSAVTGLPASLTWPPEVPAPGQPTA